MKIDFYNSLGEKARCFEHKTINTKDELDRLIDKWKRASNLKRFVFRGITEAKYKLYNSAQRSWQTFELENLALDYQSFIQSEIDKAKSFQNGLLIKFYNAFGYSAYDLSILSFLQHYGAPTPLLDWTYNFNYALFFGIDGLRHNPSDDIENYFSFYAIDTTWDELLSVEKILADDLGRIDDILFDNPKMIVEQLLQEYQRLGYSYFHRRMLFYLPGPTKSGMGFSLKSRPHFKVIYNQHNLNIINQEGLFVFNSDPNHPLEDYFKGIHTPNFNNTFHLPKILCWDIHKSLDEYVSDYLLRRRPPINREFIYPQEENIAKSAFLDYKKSK